MNKKQHSKEKHAGWAQNSTLYHFEHIPLNEAQLRSGSADSLHVVETINWTHASGDQSHVHLNKYMALNLPEAVGLASALSLCFLAGEIAESVVAVRPATEQEEQTFWKAHDLLGQETAAIYD